MELAEYLLILVHVPIRIMLADQECPCQAITIIHVHVVTSTFCMIAQALTNVREGKRA